VATALGYEFRETTRIPLTWTHTFRGPPADWSLVVPPKATRPKIRCEGHDPAGLGVALLVSVRRAVEADFAQVRHDLLPNLRGVIEVRWPAGLKGARMTPAQGIDLALRVRQALASAQIDWRLRSRELHLFISAPVALAVLIGQLLNTWGPITVYEESSGAHPYAPSLTIAPVPERVGA
jgi:hypothetical protein